MTDPVLMMALGGYVLVQFFIALAVARFNKSDIDFLLAGRSLGFPLVMFSLFATWFGSETVMGTSGAVATEGMSGGRADPFGYALCLVAMGFLLAKTMRARGYVTFGDFFRERYGALSEKLSAVILIPTSLIWAAAQLLAFGYIVSSVTGIPMEAALAAGTGIVILYTSIGGMLGDVWTDLVQGCFIIFGLVCVLVAIVISHGGLEPSMAQITAEKLSMIAPDESIFGQLDTWMIPILGSLVAQEAMGRMLAARTPDIAQKACFAAAGLYLTVGLVPVLIGLVGADLVILPEDSDAFLTVIAQELLPWPLYVMLMGALISAILSTVDSALLSVTALAGHNLVQPMFPKMDEGRKLLADKLIVVLSGLVVLAIAQSGESIFGLVEAASSFGSAGILTCVMLGLWLKSPGQGTALLTLLTGVALTAVLEYVYEIEGAYIFSVLGCVALFLAASLINQFKDKQSYA